MKVRGTTAQTGNSVYRHQKNHYSQITATYMRNPVPQNYGLKWKRPRLASFEDVFVNMDGIIMYISL